MFYHPEGKMFRFKQFTVDDAVSTMKVGTDAVLLACWAEVGDCENILDAGTGCGVIALICAQRSKAFVTGIDIHPESVEQAGNNFRASSWRNRLYANHSSLQDYQPVVKPDLLITNPPFFRNSLRPASQIRNRARHCEELSHEGLVSHAARLLTPTGRLTLVLPAFEHQAFEQIARVSGFSPMRKTFVQSLRGEAPIRILATYGFACSEPVITHLAIQDADGRYTADYRQLTREFYLNF